MRIGFLLGHEQLHQVAHSLPVALALAELGTGAEIIVAVANDRLEAEVRLLAGARLERVTLVRLRLRRRFSRAVAAALGGLAPAGKLLIYGDNLAFFRSLDVLVVAEKTSLLLKTRYGLSGLKLVHTRHGAGDRAIGFDAASARFDHVLVAGPKIRDRLIAEAGVDPDRITIVGYPKFDLAPARGPRGADPRPLVLYNPHPSPHLSSWYRMGRDVLDWFAARPQDYRLLFAPHVMLFERPLVLTIDRLRAERPGRIPPHILAAPNIEVDLGSRAATTMEYTDRADIYLGDVSSQVYEFMRTPRPCVFLDAHRTAWAGDPSYRHWTAGPVIGDVAQLGAALAEAREPHWLDVQRALVAETFDLTAEPSSVRAARAVARVAGL